MQSTAPAYAAPGERQAEYLATLGLPNTVTRETADALKAARRLGHVSHGYALKLYEGKTYQEAMTGFSAMVAESNARAAQA